MSNDTLKVGNVTLSGNFIVLDCNDDDAPEPDYEAISVPGRSGDLHLWNDRWKNKMITYHCMCRANARTNVPNILTQLIAQPGYQRITDSLHTSYYKMGTFVGGTVPVYSDGGETARFDLTFDCKPQKWLLSGETETSVASGATVTLTNPTRFPAYPIIKFKNTGTITLAHVNSSPAVSYTLTNNAPSSLSTTRMVFDCDLGDTYAASASGRNYNQHITLGGASGKPCLRAAGNTNVSFSGNMSTVAITPRWYTL